MKEGEPQLSLAVAITEYYLDRLKAEKSPARSGWRERIKRLIPG
jgi:hypothetical protein